MAFQLLRKNRRGNTMVEFLLAAWVVLTVAFGGADYSRIVNLKLAAQSAANAGANFAAQMTQTQKSCPPAVDLSGAQQAAVNDFNNAAPGFSATASLKCGSTLAAGTLTNGPCACNASTGTFVQVEVQAPFTTIGTYPYIPSPVTVRGQAIARVQ
jgi:Flp pilus assembly protein TadG